MATTKTDSSAHDSDVAGAAVLPLCASIIRKIHPREFYRRFVRDSDCRPDARALTSFRSVAVSHGGISTAHTSAHVSLGKTTVLCVIKAEVAAPAAATPNQGYLVPNVELPPLCAARFKPGPPAPLAQSLSQIIANIHARTPFIDLQDLCIAPGEAVWNLNADIYCLSYDGALLDAALLSLAAALQKLRLPITKYNEDEGCVRAACAKSGPFGPPLRLPHVPLSVSFITFEGKTVTDPTLEEEDLQAQSLFVLVDGANLTGPILGLHKTGGEPLALATLQECIRMSRERGAKLAALLADTVSVFGASQVEGEAMEATRGEGMQID